MDGLFLRIFVIHITDGDVTIPVYNMRKDWDYILFSSYKKALKSVGFEVYFSMKVV